MIYPGGKGGDGVYQAIINQIPGPVDVFIEPFLGGGAIARHMKPAPLTIGVDLDLAAIDGFAEWARAHRPGWLSGPLMKQLSHPVDGGSADHFNAAAGIQIMNLWDNRMLFGNVIPAMVAADFQRRADAAVLHAADGAGRGTHQNGLGDLARSSPALQLVCGDGITFLRHFPWRHYPNAFVYLDPPYLESTLTSRRGNLYTFEAKDQPSLKLIESMSKSSLRRLPESLQSRTRPLPLNP